MKNAEKILRRMRRSLSGWTPNDFAMLYKGFGFAVREGKEHTVYIHQKYPPLRATVARHTSLAKGYAEHAINLIDNLKALEAEELEADDEDHKDADDN